MHNSNSLDGIKVILKHMLKYWHLLIIVAIFIIAATYLQVKAPILMGDSMDTMIEYVGTSYTKNTLQEIYDSVEAGDGIPEDSMEMIEQNMDAGDQLDQIKEMSNEELKQALDLFKLQYEVFELDPDAISSGAGFTSEQIAYINNNFDQQAAFVLQSFTPEVLQQNYELIDSVLIDESDIDEKYDVFIDSLYLLLLSYLALSVANFIYNLIMARASALTSKDMRNNLFKKLETLSISFFDRSNDGDVLSRFTNDIDNINNALNQSLTQILSQVALLIGVLLMMFEEDSSSSELFGITINNSLTWQLITFAIVAIIVASLIVAKAIKYVNVQQDKLGELNGYIDERISAQKVIITNDLHEETIEGFQKYNKDYRDTSFKGQLYSGIIMPIMTGIGLINLAFLTWTGAQEVIAGTMTIGLLTAFIQYSQRFFQPLGQIFSQYNIIQLAISGAARVNDILVVKPDIVEKEDAVAIDGVKGNVVLKNVTFGYLEDQVVLDDVSLEVYQGRKVALVGPTGSGKTTVMNLLNRFYDIDQGEILFGDTNINDMTIESLRKNVGIVLQESVLFSGTIEYNIKYGNEDATREDVIEAAKTANIHEFIMSLEDGYDTQVSNESTLFSVGQKQLMSIARTILTDPDLLILDEATSNVDTVTEANIQLAMENVMKDRTSFVIAHRLKTILDSDLIVVLKDGKVIEQGNHRELLELKGFYSELYYNQFVVE